MAMVGVVMVKVPVAITPKASVAVTVLTPAVKAGRT
jgi:hypothetical protein